MSFELHLQSVGIICIVIYYIVLAKLSARMGEGLMLPHYYLLFYAAGVIALGSIVVRTYLYEEFASLFFNNMVYYVEGLYVILLLISNIIAILVSFKYWWWLKGEILGKEKLSPKSLIDIAEIIIKGKLKN